MSGLRWIAAFVLGSMMVSAGALALPEVPPDPVVKRPGFEFSTLRTVAIQDRGRSKPLETFAIETLRSVTGKTSWNGMEPVEVLFGWLVAFDREWEDEAIFRVDHQGLKGRIGLAPDRKYFSSVELRDNSKLEELVREAASKDRRKERLDTLEKKAVELRNQLQLIDYVASGQAFTVLPNPAGVNETWFSLTLLTSASDKAPYTQAQMERLQDQIGRLLKTFLSKDAAGWNTVVGEFVPFVQNELGSSAYADRTKLAVEHHFNILHPFRWSWVLYSLSLVLFLAALVTKNRPFTLGAYAAYFSAVLLHSYGFALRCYIAGRPPVTNMYESVIWVTWGCAIFALILRKFYRNDAITASATVFASVGLILVDNLPNVLDPGLHPLEPVLRSNFWLTIHVLTITLSYAAFALALCIGNVVLGCYFGAKAWQERAQPLTLYMYRAVQIGVVLLAAGTILGGVWADYSWGRFWGWDPKEVWALIALLLYLAVLHGRFTGWLQGFGFVTATICSFLGVLMAWYGVNFVLGVGLHSYGFGTGGLGYVLGYLAAQLGYVGLSYVRYRKLVKAGSISTAIFPRSAS